MRTVFAREKAQAIGEKVCQSVLMINESVGGAERHRDWWREGGQSAGDRAGKQEGV